MLVVKSKMIDEKKAMVAAMEIVEIDYSNREHAIEHTKKFLTVDCNEPESSDSSEDEIWI